MKTLCCVISDKYGNLEKLKISYLLEIIFIISIISSKCKKEDEKIFGG